MAPPLPDFSDLARFPTFAQLPLEGEEAEGGGGPPPARAGDWHLVAQVRHDMTITKPTLVLADRSGAEFALVFDGGPGREDAASLFRARGLRAGATAVVPRARRAVPRAPAEGGTAQGPPRGFVRVRGGGGAAAEEEDETGEVWGVPGPLERVLALGASVREGEGEACCASCGGPGEGPLMRCLGCGRVRYCGKACQVKGWSEGGHKADCKVLKALDRIWG